MKVEFIRKLKNDKKKQTLIVESKKDVNALKIIADAESFKKKYLKDMDFSDKFYVKLDGKKIGFSELSKMCYNAIENLTNESKSKSKKKDKDKSSKSKSKKSDTKKSKKKNDKKKKSKKDDNKKSSKKILKNSKKVSEGLYKAPDGHAIIGRK